MPPETSTKARAWAVLVWALVGFFVLNLLALIAAVVTSSFAQRWLGTWLPTGWTTRWYLSAWDEFQLRDVLIVTFEIVFAVVAGPDPARLFRHVLVPLLLPGILASLLLVLVRTIAMFELTFLTAGPDSQTLVVALYYAVFAAGVRATQSVDAMAVTYMVTTLVWLLIALRFVNLLIPTEVARDSG